VRLKFCAACRSTHGLEYHHLVTRPEGGNDDETNIITLCGQCHAKLHERRLNGIYNVSERTKAGLAGRVLSGESLRKLTLETEKEIYEASERGVAPVRLAEQYGVSRQAIYHAIARYKKVRLGQTS
jgi:HNH endonuclease